MLADLKAAFERIVHPARGVVSLRKSTMQDIASIDTPDATTVVFGFNTVNASMLNNLASPVNCAYSAAKLKEDLRLPENNIVGSGAFQFVEYVRGSYMLTKRFDGYFRRGLPYLDGYKAYFVNRAAWCPVCSAANLMSSSAAELRASATSCSSRPTRTDGSCTRARGRPWTSSSSTPHTSRSSRRLR